MSRAAAAAPAGDRYAVRRRWALAGLVVLLAAVAALSLTLGAVTVRPGEVLDVLADHLGLPGDDPTFQADAVVWNIRLPRLLLGLTVGAALAVAGAALQGVFRNPMADPHLLGIGPGAALGAVIGSLAGATRGAIGAGVAAGVLTALLVRRLGRAPAMEPSRFILAGVALGAALTAWVGFVVFSADSLEVPPIEFWLLGSLVGSTWRILGTTAAIVALTLAGLLAAARTLDVLSLGEAEARHLGVDVDLATTVIVMTVGAVTGATVGAVGVVVFVGLLVPHLVRRLSGPAHRHLMILSALGGAVFVAASDLAARTIAEPADIPVGLVTAVVGGPFFIWLIQRRREAT